MTGQIASSTPPTNVTVVTRTLLVLPALIGLMGVGATLLAGVFGGVTDGSQGWAATAVAAVLVLVTVLTGDSYGLYAAMTILAVGGMVADGGPNSVEITLLPISLLVIHELIRFSLDARRPSRFGPGLVVRYLVRVVACSVFVVAISALLHGIIKLEPTGGIWIPIGLAASGVLLFVRRGAELLDRSPVGNNQAVRVLIGLVLTAVVVTLVTIGAEAQTESEGNATPAATTTITTTTTTAPAEEVTESAGSGITVPPWVVVIVVIVLAVMIYLILQRDEAIYELEEVDRRVEDNVFDMAAGQLSNTENETVEVDEDVLARMLRDLQLDISGEVDPGRAIRFGYAKIEQRLADLRLTRTAVETEREFLLRAIPALGSAGQAMTVLTRLFERARFSHEPVDESMRQQALSAIDELLATVGDRRPHESAIRTVDGNTNGNGVEGEGDGR
ncbi:MAG: DUF4129 domain-containing protein [Acidimicrobiales bacterium]